MISLLELFEGKKTLFFFEHKSYAYICNMLNIYMFMSKFMLIDSNIDNCSVYIAALTKLIHE